MDLTQENSRQPTINLAGEKVALGPLRRDLIPRYLAWFNDFEVTRTLLLGSRPVTREAEEAWYEAACNDRTAVHFTIYERATLRPIGNADLHGIDYGHRIAEYGIAIGEKDCWGKGYGTEATALVLDYAFTCLGLHNVMLLAYAFNERAIRAYRRAGFREIGRRREARRLAGSACDIIYMDCLATEFRSPLLHSL